MSVSTAIFSCPTSVTLFFTLEIKSPILSEYNIAFMRIIHFINAFIYVLCKEPLKIRS